MQHKQPVTAALAATQGAILLAKLTHSLVIVVPTVSGRTVKQLTSISVDKIIIAITSSPMVAKQLQLYKGVLAILYDSKFNYHLYLYLTITVQYKFYHTITSTGLIESKL